TTNVTEWSTSHCLVPALRSSRRSRLSRWAIGSAMITDHRERAGRSVLPAPQRADPAWRGSHVVTDLSVSAVTRPYHAEIKPGCARSARREALGERVPGGARGEALRLGELLHRQRALPAPVCRGAQ